MRRGVSLASYALNGSGDTQELEDWYALTGKKPFFVPIWCPFSTPGTAPYGGLYPTALLAAIRALGIEPMIYMHSTNYRYPRTYQSYLDGDHDAQIDTFATAAAAAGKRLIIRWDHEQ